MVEGGGREGVESRICRFEKLLASFRRVILV